ASSAGRVAGDSRRMARRRRAAGASRAAHLGARLFGKFGASRANAFRYRASPCAAERTPFGRNDYLTLLKTRSAATKAIDGAREHAICIAANGAKTEKFFAHDKIFAKNMLH